MKAVRIERYGNEEVVALAEVERPTPGDNELLVKVRMRFMVISARIVAVTRSMWRRQRASSCVSRSTLTSIPRRRCQSQR